HDRLEGECVPLDFQRLQLLGVLLDVGFVALLDGAAQLQDQLAGLEALLLLLLVLLLVVGGAGGDEAGGHGQSDNGRGQHTCVRSHALLLWTGVTNTARSSGSVPSAGEGGWQVGARPAVVAAAARPGVGWAWWPGSLGPLGPGHGSWASSIIRPGIAFARGEGRGFGGAAPPPPPPPGGGGGRRKKQTRAGEPGRTRGQGIYAS